MSDHSHATPKAGPVIGAIFAILLAYAGTLALGLPQRGTEMIAAAHAGPHGEEADAGHYGDNDAAEGDHAPEATSTEESAAEEPAAEAPAAEEHAEGETHAEEGATHGESEHQHAAGAAPPIWMVTRSPTTSTPTALPRKTSVPSSGSPPAWAC